MKKPVKITSVEGAELTPANREGALEKFFGCLRVPGMRALSLDEISELIAEGWAGELDEGDEARLLKS